MQPLIRIFLFFCFSFVLYVLQAQSQKIVVPIDPIEIQEMSHINGDCDMYGHNPQISIDVQASIDGDYLVISGWMKLKEDKKDWTTFAKEFQTRIFVKGLQRESVIFDSFEEGTGALRAEAGMHNHRYTTFEGQGLIQSANILSDTPSEDCGKLGGKIQLRPVVIHVSEVL